MNNLPRILLCASASGGGKTTVTCAILQALVNRKLNPAAFKCGPDYIDPMFHSRIIGAKSRNLDLFLTDRDTVRQLLWENGTGVGLSIIEGVMGYYDGIAMGSESSTWELAVETDTPAVLIVDGRGRALSMAAEVMGFIKFRNPSMIKGVILNRVSSPVYHRVSQEIRHETGIEVYGFLPELDDTTLESRHLGLITADEVSNLREKLSILARKAEETIDLDGLIELAKSAPPLEIPEERLPEPVEGGPKIAVARDKAFCFYYEDAISLLKKLGAEIVGFSPMYDKTLPDGCGGLCLGGGYPELYADILSENEPMRAVIRDRINAGMPTIAECGGFLYLHETLKDSRGREYPMVGVINGKAFGTDRLSRFGYVTLTAKKDGFLVKRGEKLAAHEFHYWDCDAPGGDFWAEKPRSERGWECGYSTESLYAGFPHIHLCSAPYSALRFVRAAGDWIMRERG